MGTTSLHRRLSFRFIIFVIVLSLILPILPVKSYYADVTIMVDTSGFVTIDGLTDYPDLLIKDTQNYTSKQHSIWLLNITKEGPFSEFVYVLTLPKGSLINYIKASGSIRIEENQGSLIIRGFGENDSLSIVLQYQIAKSNESFFQGNFIYFILIPAIVIVIILLVFFLVKEKRTKEPYTDEKEPAAPSASWKGLNHRQKQIMQLLSETTMPLTQTDIQKQLKIPKASVSRNIHGLERKGLIEKEQIGMSNLIRVKKP
jgi:uncharacterized membrane protein